MQQLATTMTAQEFAQHHALELHEPMHYGAVGSVLAALANGPLTPPASLNGRNWHAHDFAPSLWQDLAEQDQAAPAEKALTVDDIMARARMVGMVQ